MNVLDYWERCSKPSGTRIFMKKIDLDTPQMSIFRIPTENQPIFVIDNIFSKGDRHFLLESENIGVSEMGSKINLSYDILLLDFQEGNYVKTSTIIVDFLTGKFFSLKNLR